MVTKEMVDARWKLAVGGLLSALFAVIVAAAYELTKAVMADPRVANIPGITPGGIAAIMNYDTYIWSQWFAKNAQIVLLIIAAILGAGYIAGEVNKGSIFLLLSRPLSRTRVLFTKYATGAAVLLVISVVGTAAMYITTIITGHPQNVGGMLLSTLLLWLSGMFALSLATLFSVIFSDVLRPLGLVLVILVLLGIPGFLGQPDWSLPNYWASSAAYLGQSFPLKELLVSLIAAALPLLVAVPLFRRQQY